MKRYGRNSALVILQILLCGAVSTLAFAASSSMFQVKISGKTYSCGKVSSRWQSGKVVRGQFKSFKKLQSEAKASAKRSSGSRRTSYLNKAAQYGAAAKLGDPICKPGPTTTVPPTATPSAPLSGNFDGQGNVTSTGKTRFGIPQNLSANITTGRGIYISFCTGCHADKYNKTFSYVRSQISLSPMLFSTSEIDDGKLANILAYINRFQQ